MKIDKYIRLICSILKTYRAFNPKTKFSHLYKELLMARRVIRWESKYDTIKQIIQEQQENKSMLLFKFMQIIGDCVDLIAFWIKVLNKGNSKKDALIDRLEQIQSNFYFGECIIWLAIYTYRYSSLRKETAVGSQQKRKSILNKVIENGLKSIKYLMDVLTSYNNSSLKPILGEINHKLAGLLTFLSSGIGIYLMWR